MVAATEIETEWMRGQASWELVEEGLWKWQGDRHTFSLLVTGIGMVNTAMKLGAYFAQQKPDLAVNIGIAGAFAEELQIGEVVEVVEEIFGDLGAEGEEGFLDLEAMGFPLYRVAGEPVYNRLRQPINADHGIPRVCALTVNKVHGRAESIAAARQHWNPDIESMEGAAFFRACLEWKIEFRELRSISNRVEPRDTSKWNIPLAVKNIQEWTWNWLQTLE